MQKRPLILAAASAACLLAATLWWMASHNAPREEQRTLNEPVIPQVEASENANVVKLGDHVLYDDVRVSDDTKTPAKVLGPEAFKALKPLASKPVTPSQ